MTRKLPNDDFLRELLQNEEALFYYDMVTDFEENNLDTVSDVYHDYSDKCWKHAKKLGITDYWEYKKLGISPLEVITMYSKGKDVYDVFNKSNKEVKQTEQETDDLITAFKNLTKKPVTEDITNNTCVICGQEFEGYGHNAMPLKSGKCCDKCNMEHVIPERILVAKMTQNKELDTLANKVREALIEGGIKPQKVLIFPNRPMISFLIEGRRDVEHSLADFLITGYLDNNIYDYEISMKHESNQKDNLVAWHQYKIIWGKEI